MTGGLFNGHWRTTFELRVPEWRGEESLEQRLFRGQSFVHAFVPRFVPTRESRLRGPAGCGRCRIGRRRCRADR
jgi:hypothetical protein